MVIPSRTAPASIFPEYGYVEPSISKPRISYTSTTWQEYFPHCHVARTHNCATVLRTRALLNSITCTVVLQIDSLYSSNGRRQSALLAQRADPRLQETTPINAGTTTPLPTCASLPPAHLPSCAHSLPVVLLYFILPYVVIFDAYHAE